ncbi:putative alkaline shock family protein YloU [Spirochaeta isovalerica]|uniref:Putative alkaline shock family protein YloU n=2 Tax=Spirochaeta isovalerica TaxID=150 RepID=A0A841R8K7_9SPIO|nr:putative alkaline shock family protein YloU [Spirochaeta isovalerica]
MSANQEEKGKVTRLLNQAKWMIMGVKVFALVGKSGTGKSFRARLVAEKFNIPYIIDDGLLIHDKKIIAGRSAKKEKEYVSAIKTALYDDPHHRADMIKALEKIKLKQILLVGTSEKMVVKITERLNLPPVTRFIHIEDIASQEEIEKAIHSRHSEGKHVIPVPSIEVHRDYAHILSDSIRVFFKRNWRFGLKKKNQAQIFEKSVVQPAFQKEDRGKIQISEAALSQMILHCVDEFDAAILVKKITVKKDRAGYKISISVEAAYGEQLSGKIHDLQAYILDRIERFTGLMIDRVEIRIDKIRKE